MSIQTHIVQFKLNFYRADSIIKSEFDLNREKCIYSISEDKVYREIWNSKNPSLLREMGETEDLEKSGSYYYFYTDRDIFFIDYLYEVGDFDYSDSICEVKWLDECFGDIESEFSVNLSNIYKDNKSHIDMFINKNKHLSKFIFERMLNISTHSYSYSYGYDGDEYGLSTIYNGMYKLNHNASLSKADEFKLIHGMSEESFNDMYNE